MGTQAQMLAALLASGSGGVWPDSLTTAAGGLVSRYDFSSPAGVVLSGAEITTAYDLGPNGYDISPPSPTERPAYAASILNGLGGADFSNDTNSELKSAALGLTGEFTYGFVTSGGTNLLGLFDGTPGATLGCRFWGNNEVDFMIVTIPRQPFSGSAAGTNVIVTISVAGTTKTGTAYKSGVSSATAGISTASAPALNDFALGTINGGANGDYQDFIHEVAIWQGVLSAGERGTWDAYISAKWGI